MGVMGSVQCCMGGYMGSVQRSVGVNGVHWALYGGCRVCWALYGGDGVHRALHGGCRVRGALHGVMGFIVPSMGSPHAVLMGSPSQRSVGVMGCIGCSMGVMGSVGCSMG